MKYGVYSVLDANVGYSVPTIQENDSVALRLFENALHDTKSIWHTHSNDFSLYRIGSFDTHTGELDPDVPLKLVDASSIVLALKESDK